MKEATASRDMPGVAIFGSSRAARWVGACLQSQGFSVRAIWARSGQEAESIAQELEIPFHTCRVDEVLLRKDVGLVVILCPPSLHSQIAVKALGIGKHVLCGVPGGLSQAECLRMVQAAQYYPSLMALMAYSLRFLPSMVSLKDLLCRGYLGESLTLVDARISCESLLDTSYGWSCDAGMGGGVLSLLGSHLIDLLSFLQLGKVLRVHASLHTMTKTTDNIKGIRQITADDVAVLQLHLVSGTFVTITINSCLAGFNQEITFVGTSGYLKASQGDLRGRKNGATQEDIFTVSTETAEQGAGMPSLLAIGLRRMVSNLGETFRGTEGRDKGATFREGLYVQAVIEALRRSSERREWRKVELMEEDGVMEGQ